MSDYVSLLEALSACVERHADDHTWLNRPQLNEDDCRQIACQYEVKVAKNQTYLEVITNLSAAIKRLSDAVYNAHCESVQVLRLLQDILPHMRDVSYATAVRNMRQILNLSNDAAGKNAIYEYIWASFDVRKATGFP
jgi:hypothetical protein